MSAISVFLRYIRCDADGKIDASGILSRKCYEEWFDGKRENIPRNPEEAFRKTVIGHCNYLTRDL